MSFGSGSGDSWGGNRSVVVGVYIKGRSVIYMQVCKPGSET